MKSSVLCKWLRRLVLGALALLAVIAGMTEFFRHESTVARIAPWLLSGCLVLLVLWVLAGDRVKPVQSFVRDLLLALVPASLAVVVYANMTPVWASRGRIFTDVTRVPATRVGLVFGTSDRVASRENLYFRYRIEAATQAWNAGKVNILIVSGDNISRYYNEPNKMRQALIDRGIPANRIVCDPFGLCTLDSVVRAKEIYSADSILFISQRFQNERAIYLAKANGITAFGFDARDVDAHEGLKTKIREVGARVKMWLDVNSLNTRPHHLGEKIALPELH